MENERREIAPYHYRKHDSVWQRVAPSLNPYPGDAPLTAAPAEPASPAASAGRRRDRG